MTTLYLAEVAVIVAAIAGTARLRAIGDQRWAAHQARRRQSAVVVRLMADSETFRTAMQQTAAALVELGEKLKAIGWTPPTRRERAQAWVLWHGWHRWSGGRS